MKKSLMLNIPALVLVLTLAIVTSAHAWFATASCTRKTLEVSAVGNAGSWGLKYGSASALADIDERSFDYKSFNHQAVSCYAYQHAFDYSRKKRARARSHASGFDEQNNYRSMDDQDDA